VEWRREREEKGIEREKHPISISFGCLVACPVRFPSDLIPNLPIRDTLPQIDRFGDFSFLFGGSVLFGVLIGSDRVELGSHANRGVSWRIGGRRRQRGGAAAAASRGRRRGGGEGRGRGRCGDASGRRRQARGGGRRRSDAVLPDADVQRREEPVRGALPLVGSGRRGRAIFLPFLVCDRFCPGYVFVVAFFYLFS
jgi:hypothetical protein